MEGASVIVREQVAAGNGVTISAPTGLPASYTLTLSSTLPSTTNGLTLTNPSGNQSYLDKGAANTVLKMDSAGTNLEYDKLTQVNMGAVGQQAGTSSGTFTTAGTTFVAITGASATITTTGRPVMLMYQPSSTSANTGYVGGQQGSLSDPSANIRLKRDSTTIVNFAFLAGGSGIFASPGFSYLDVVGAGTYTYTLEAAGQDSNSIAHANNMVLVAYEL